jgi:hypothetical protein
MIGNRQGKTEISLGGLRGQEDVKKLIFGLRAIRS